MPHDHESPRGNDELPYGAHFPSSLRARIRRQNWVSTINLIIWTITAAVLFTVPAYVPRSTRPIIALVFVFGVTFVLNWQIREIHFRLDVRGTVSGERLIARAGATLVMGVAGLVAIAVLLNNHVWLAAITVAYWLAVTGLALVLQLVTNRAT